MKKYYKTKKEAQTAKTKANNPALEIFRMPKGSRKAGWFMVGDYMTYLNTY